MSLVSSILPKNERKQLVLRSNFWFVFWKNWRCQKENISPHCATDCGVWSVLTKLLAVSVQKSQFITGVLKYAHCTVEDFRDFPTHYFQSSLMHSFPICFSKGKFSLLHIGVSSLKTKYQMGLKLCTYV